MGLDTVELVMAVETHFDLEIPDSEAQKMLTVGDLHAFLLVELRRLGRANTDPIVVYDELRTIVVKQLGVKPSAVVPEARFVKDLGAD